MSILNTKYIALKPQLDYLADEVILAQAWKKSNSYIRSHNWYSDTLELDCSAANLENLINEWKMELEVGIYTPDEMRLVPAPKSDDWAFNHVKEGTWAWGPRQREESEESNATTELSKELRPLAHLTIRDQTVASAIMLCLADAIESEQGSTNPEHNHKVWSYGNRLFCDWDGSFARFRWGNSGVYSKYFQDYQRFLERPIQKAQVEQQSLVSSESMYEVHLDLTAFFDSIDRERLVRVLKSIATNYFDPDFEQDEDFWDLVEKTIFGWHWSEDDQRLAGCLKNSTLPEGRGIPQGLVASGFFANAYLIDLDRVMSEMIGETDGNFTVIDYCRYVDDLRLLVKVSDVDEHELATWVEEKIQPKIENFEGLILNSAKSKFEKIIARQSETSSRMKVIQQAISGPQDKSAIDEILGSLDGLFTLAELCRAHGELRNKGCNIPLARIDQPQMDVREDTLLRFAANRITVVLNKKRLLVGEDTTEANGINELDRFCESMARRFIAVWAQNPSLVAVLKKGFSLFPHPKILKPVLQVLINKIIIKKNERITLPREKRVALYCISEIFRFAALELRQNNKELWPSHSDLDGFIKVLIRHGRSIISKNIPWYLRQQIILFLAIHSESACSGKLQIVDGDEDNYQLLQCIMCGNHPLETDNALENRVSIFIVAHQICNDEEKIVGGLGAWLDNLKQKNRQKATITILESVSLNDPSLFRKLLEYGQQVAADWYGEASKICRRYGFDHHALLGELDEFNGREVPLASVIKRHDNPFAYENGLLALANAIIPLLEKEATQGDKSLSAQFLKIKCSDWRKIQRADTTQGESLITLSWVTRGQKDKRYKLPSWLANDDDSRSLYQLGCFLRSCAIGDLDFTTSKSLVSDLSFHRYFGINSSWYKRRIGMAHQPETLNGEAAPMSSWVSELFYRLLQWPGLTIYNFRTAFLNSLTLKGIHKIIVERLATLEKIYGKSSDLPVVVERVSHSFKNQNHLCVVMVQSLLPQLADFQREGPLLGGSSYRKKHREHVASLAKIVYDKLRIEKKAKGIKIAKPFTDLIIFPELSVHPDDIDILKQLADKTGAIIFTGLTYLERNSLLINTALWLIPFVNGNGRQWLVRYQGKKNPTKDEIKKIGVNPWRPYQLVIELEDSLGVGEQGFRLSGAICYDATDIGLAADLRKVINTFIVVALNKDIETFDTMVDALHYHMFQPVILVNSGEFGGSAAKAPYKEKYNKRIAHVHGSNQVSISMFELNMRDFGKNNLSLLSGKELKTKPAGMDLTV